LKIRQNIQEFNEAVSGHSGGSELSRKLRETVFGAVEERQRSHICLIAEMHLPVGFLAEIL
jgi:hypothetical protein